MIDHSPLGRGRILGIVGFATTLIVLLTLTDSRTRSLLANTCYLSTMTGLLSLPVGAVLAWVITRTDAPLRRWVMLTCVVSLFIPLYLHTAAWDAGFGLQGWFHVGERLASAPLLSKWRGAIWVHTLYAIPWVVLVVTIGLRAIPSEWEDSAVLDARPSRAAWHVVVPHLRNTLLMAFLWVLVLTSGEITVTDVFGVRTYAEEVYVGFARDAPEVADASIREHPWVGLLLLGWLVIGAVIVCNWFASSDQPPTAGGSRVYRVRQARWAWSGAMMASLFTMAAVPLGNLLFKLGIVVEQIGEARHRSWSMWKACRLLWITPSSYSEELGWTLAISQLAAVAAIALAIPAAWWAVRRRSGRLCVAVLVGLTLAVPGPFLGIGIIRLLNQPELPLFHALYDRSIAAPWLALFIRGWPIATLILWQAFRSVPRTMLESSRLEGAGTVRQLFLVVVPMRGAAVLGAWFVTMAVAAGELTASILVVPPGVTTLSIRIFGLVHYGVEDRLAALCLWSIAAFVGLGMIGLWLLRRGRPTRVA